MDESRALDALSKMVGQKVIVILKNGKTYKGILKAADPYTNIALEKPEVFISGYNVAYCSLA
ncbi:MAG: LSM domain-containing protein [archaeon]